MAQTKDTQQMFVLEEAITVLFCLVDDAYYRNLNPKGQRYASLKKLSDSEVLALALLQQLRGVESERSFLRDAQRFFSHLFPGVLGLVPSSFHRRIRKLRRFLEPLRRSVLAELVGDPETMIVDSTLLSVLHPRQVSQSAGFDGAAWVRWGSFSLYGVKLHMLCATNRVPISYELTAANVAEVRLTGEVVGRGVGHFGSGGGSGAQAAWGSGLPERGFGAGTGRAWGSVGHRAGSATRGEAAGRDSVFESQAGLRGGRDTGHDANWASNAPGGEDNGLHLRILCQPSARPPARKDEGTLGVNLATHI